MDLDLAAAVAPVELLARGDRGRLAQFRLADIEMIGSERRLVGQPRPRDRRVLLPHAEKTAEAEHCVGDVAADLVDHQALDGADLLSARAADRRAFHPIARDQAVGPVAQHVGLHGCLRRSSLPMILSHDLIRSCHACRTDCTDKKTRKRPALFQGSEQRRHLTDLERPEKDGSVVEADGKRHRLLAVEHRALAERRHQPGRRILAREPAEAGDQSIERADRRTDLSFRHHAVDVEHLEQFLDTDDGDLKIAVEPARRRKLEGAGASRDHIVLLNARLGDLDLAVTRLPFLEADRPRLRRDVVDAVDHRGDLRVDRLGGERMKLLGAGAFEPQDRLDHRVLWRGAGRLAPVQFEMPRAEHRSRSEHRARATPARSATADRARSPVRVTNSPHRPGHGRARRYRAAR